MRGLPQKINRNVAIVALYICGFPMNDIARLLEMDRRNCQKFLRKYMPKYRGFLMEQISRYMTIKRGYKPSEGNRWNKMLKELEENKIQNKKIIKKN